MLSADSATSIRMLAIIPDTFKPMAYTKVKVGDVKTIDKVSYRVYKARTDAGDYVVRKDGSNVLNVVAYVGFTDMTYSTFKGDTAIAQLASETGEFPFDKEGTYDYDIKDLKVKIIEVEQLYGRAKKSYKVFAFEPLD